MKVVSVEPFIVSVPYRHREVSSVVARDGVTDVLVKVTTDDGVEGWGEACSGADVVSVEAALRAMIPFVAGRDPWNREAMRADLYRHGLWQFRPMTGNFAWAGLDMALGDICGKAAGQPLYRLYGGPRRREVDYFFYLARGSREELAAQCAEGVAAGFSVFYLKVGLDFAADREMVAATRAALGDGPRIRLDANGSWTLPEARHHLQALAEYDIEFVEQPVRDYPLAQMAEVRGWSPIPLLANEGLWSEADAYDRIVARVADAYCFSPYWVGSLAAFHRLAHIADLHGLLVCKHTHGELGVAAAACQHVLLTLPNITDGNQQTAYLMAHDVLRAPIPIASGPRWGVPEGPGLGIEIDEAAVAEATQRYRREGQFLPYQPEMLAGETR
ncbi:MAG: mandelate racemase/muconate lactonizing enzyme family protein [Thermomicrobiales bacterium]|nr:mandelate racemase/muconate lactonizing enzyme family protein [Thermomicrobiales bacterium]